MISSADLFSLTLLATGGLYACMLAYFNGLVGAKRPNSQIMWNSEPVIWIITLLLTFSVVFKIVEPGGVEGPGVWYLIGTGNLLVIYIYLVIELARHDLPKIGYWGMAALTAAAVIYTTATIVMGFSTQTMDLGFYKDVLATLMATMTYLLLLVLVFNLLRSFRSSLMKIWMADPDSRDRLTAGGIAVSTTGEVSNPQGALSDINLELGEKTESATLNPGGGIIVDFGIRRIEDHGFRSDLRIASSNTEQPIVVEVSNDKLNWEVCEREDKILTDWDVPYFNSPWRYVRVRNTSEDAIDISEVYDLD
ncbi:MAG: hypothetical protein COB20_04405 [SAR86 cluster bacterium]|uniref:Uncharacterized protein n=1 Tax=SAR86 cluster bacterium TaxID=2030880 RepID=A0A2A4XCD2_9GAMM|nr:MAG: hypothetical protein COB20_04405 [SAR86 cluster bacterium]